MKLPAYFLIGAVPVQVIETQDGGLDVLRYSVESASFERAMEYLEAVTFPGRHSNVESVSAAAFEDYVASLRARS